MIDAYFLRHHGVSPTGRITSKVPGFKELPMNVTNLNRTDLTDNIDHSFFAPHQDEDGWVFSRGGIDG